MSAGPLNLPLEKGATFYADVTITDPAIDFTGYNARAKIAATPGAAAIVSLTVSGETKAVGSYVLRLSLTPTQTAALTGTPNPVGGRTLPLGFWDLEIYTALDAIVYRVLEGTVSLSLEVTIP